MQKHETTKEDIIIILRNLQKKKIVENTATIIHLG